MLRAFRALAYNLLYIYANIESSKLTRTISEG